MKIEFWTFLLGLIIVQLKKPGTLEKLKCFLKENPSSLSSRVAKTECGVRLLDFFAVVDEKAGT
jgi:hypothetical protein